MYILMLSIHGLIRGHDLELGRDADTGGQTKYVVDLARALGERTDVSRVDLVTRRFVDPAVSPDYAEPIEPHSTDSMTTICPSGWASSRPERISSSSIPRQTTTRSYPSPRSSSAFSTSRTSR